jgi:hypothetical protein
MHRLLLIRELELSLPISDATQAAMHAVEEMTSATRADHGVVDDVTNALEANLNRRSSVSDA